MGKAKLCSPGYDILQAAGFMLLMGFRQSFIEYQIKHFNCSNYKLFLLSSISCTISQSLTAAFIHFHIHSKQSLLLLCAVAVDKISEMLIAYQTS